MLTFMSKILIIICMGLLFTAVYSIYIAVDSIRLKKIN